MRFIPCRIDKGDGTLAGAAAKLLHGFRMPGKLAAVSIAEFVPTVRVMAEPRSQFGTWRDFLDPFVELRGGLADATWPQAINEDPGAVGFPGRLVGALEPDVRSTNTMSDDSGYLRKLANSLARSFALEFNFSAEPVMITVNRHHRSPSPVSQVVDRAIASFD